MSRLRAVSKVVVQVPGKALTVVGPLLLFWGLPLPQYALFESIFALASLGALLLGWGLSAALPHDYLACSSGQVLSAMRRNFNLTALAVAIGVAGLAAFGATAAEVGERSAAASWSDCVTLFLLLCCGLMGQNFVAAVLRIRGWIGVAALCEHSAWLFVVLACVAWRLFEANVNMRSGFVTAAAQERFEFALVWKSSACPQRPALQGRDCVGNTQGLLNGSIAQ